jgi:hypothetical protein
MSDPTARLVLGSDTIEQDLARLVLTLVEFVRRLLEAQALRRLEAGTITDEEGERLGQTLLRARAAVVSLCERLGTPPESLNLDLGPLGRLL